MVEGTQNNSFSVFVHFVHLFISSIFLHGKNVEQSVVAEPEASERWRAGKRTCHMTGWATVPEADGLCPKGWIQLQIDDRILHASKVGMGRCPDLQNGGKKFIQDLKTRKLTFFLKQDVQGMVRRGAYRVRSLLRGFLHLRPFSSWWQRNQET